MLRKSLTAMVVAGALVILTASTALGVPASSKVAGSGLTNDGNTLGFNAKSDLTGHYTYVAHSATFMVMCSSYDWYKLSDANGFPQVNVRATCLDQDGRTIYMETYFIDRGEPGVGAPREGDVARVYFTYNAGWKSDPSDDPGRFWEDFSLIMKGNVQILPAQTSR